MSGRRASENPAPADAAVTPAGGGRSAPPARRIVPVPPSPRDPDAESSGDARVDEAADPEIRRQQVRDLIGRLLAVHDREDSRRLLTQDETVEALAETLRQATRLGLSREALALDGPVEALAAELGPRHRHTLTVRFALARACSAAGRNERAVTLHEQVVEGAAELLGVDHPRVLTARHGLAAAYRAAGDPERAVATYERMVDDTARLLGENHPDAFSARNNLALACEEAGEVDRARELYEEVVADAVRVLGDGHPYLAVFRRNLDRLRGGTERSWEGT